MTDGVGGSGRPEATANTADPVVRHLALALDGKRLAEARLGASPERLRDDLVAYACRGAPFYRALCAPDGATPGFLDLPVVDKATIRADPDAFLACDPGDIVLSQTTSGTSGQPLTVRYDAASWYLSTYASFRGLAPLVPSMARRFQQGALAVLIVNDNPDRADAVMVNPALDNALQVRRVINRGATEDRETVAAVAGRLVPLVNARPRALQALIAIDAAVEAETGRRLEPEAIVTSGDNLHDDVRRAVRARFRAPLHNMYASQEAGMVAVAPADREHLVVLGQHALVEVLGPDGRLAVEGEGEMVVTNLVNWAMPFLRYRTGDQASVVVDETADGPRQRIVRLAGRDSVFFRLGGGRVNPSVFNPVFEGLPVDQFQVRQRPDGSLLVRWRPVPGVDDVEAVGEKIAAGMAERLGFAPALTVEAVDAIAPPGIKVQRYVRDAAGDAAAAAPAGAGA